jgi:hypothetical protein
MSDYQRHPVSDPDAPRTWTPDSKCRDEIMNEVLEIILDADGPISQKQIGANLAALHPEIKMGTIRAYVSASLLHFRQAGWVVSNSRDEERSPVWEVC